MDCREAAKSNRGGKRQPQSKKNGACGLRSRTRGCKPTSESEEAPFFFVLGLTLGGAPPSGGREGGRNTAPQGLPNNTDRCRKDVLSCQHRASRKKMFDLFKNDNRHYRIDNEKTIIVTITAQALPRSGTKKLTRPSERLMSERG